MGCGKVRTDGGGDRAGKGLATEERWTERVHWWSQLVAQDVTVKGQPAVEVSRGQLPRPRKHSRISPVAGVPSADADRRTGSAVVGWPCWVAGHFAGTGHSSLGA
jgi:hypothetical protein